MTLVGSSLGAAVAIDFAVNHPEAVSKLIFIGASVYAEGTRDMTGVPKFVPYAGAFVLKSLPLRVLATHLTFYKTPDEFFESVQIGRLHCLLPWWEDATVHFMITGGYNVVNQINQVLFCKHPNYDFIQFSLMLHFSIADPITLSSYNP
ncbi:uncharacterized protein LOC123397877 [Hordeum vulgare subsp. vulgare]|uniref:uncharacterized protein LOC123397877 n=1 Tax=Hordeum vulgare subsp. vulgare TaxID=112509 RepID=UPI001D1A3596|nr:uncharacterized protein LOC123397877 [Hordeum vulgare subsp. vulgare]